MKTVVVGATPNPSRYAFIASEMLTEHGHEVVPLGIRKGEVAGKPIMDIRKRPAIPDVDTVTLYISPPIQQQWYDYLIGLKPRRVIFNPGTENEAFQQLLEKKNIAVEEACTLVLLRTAQY